jgi:hypothetical protein
MTGHLALPTGPANANAVRKDYVDNATNTEVTRANAAYQAKDAQLFSNIPTQYKSSAYTTVASDAQKCIVGTANSVITMTIPASSSVNYPLGTTITFANRSGNNSNMQIAINTDTIYLAGSTTSGTRTLAGNGVATAFKTDGTVWLMSGVGLT